MSNAAQTDKDAKTTQLEQRIVLGFSVIAGLGLILFGLIEVLFGDRLIAALDILAGAALTVVGMALLLGARLQVCTTVFLVTIFTLGYGISLLSGGSSAGVLIALPVFAFLVALLQSKRWPLFWYGLLIGLPILAWVLTQSDLRFPVTFEQDWMATSRFRTPLVAAILAIAITGFYRKTMREVRAAADANADRWRAACLETDARRARFEHFAGLAADWFWETDKDFRLTYLSSAFTDATGIPIAEALGKTPPEVAELYSGHRDEDALDSMKNKRAFENERIVWRRPDGSLVILFNSGRPRIDRDGHFVGFRGVVHDVTDTEVLTRKLARQADHDDLTGLLNRRAFSKRLGVSLREAGRGAHSFALMALDLDRFKPINDRAGHAAGDRMLREVAAVLSELPEDVFVGRLGGDEFLAAMPCFDLEAANALAKQALGRIESIVLPWNGDTLSISASIGLLCEAQVDSLSVNRWTRRADELAYAAKDQGGARIHVGPLED